MSDPGKAVFLSYASQDAEAAKRICDALRAAGVEVWFDQNELVGGDQWDGKIRGQISSCALFVPLISANTQARLEGYFRLEWKLAAQRTHTMADEMTFLLPVLIDGTRDAEARVPAEFRAVQWTKLPAGEATPAFCVRVRKLLDGTAAGVVDPGLPGSTSPATSRPVPPRRGASKWWWVLPIFGVTMAMVLVMKEARKEPAPSSSNGPAPTMTQPVSEARKLANQAMQLLEDPNFTRETSWLADELCQRALALDAGDAEVWAVAAFASHNLFSNTYDTSAGRREKARSQAARASQVDPQSVRAALAVARCLEGTGNDGELLRILQELHRRAPADQQVLFSLVRAEGGMGNETAVQDLIRKFRALPRTGLFPLALWFEELRLRTLGRYAEAEAMLDEMLADPGVLRGAYYEKLNLLMRSWHDLAAAAPFIEKIPARFRQEPAFGSAIAYYWLWRAEPEKALQALAQVPQDYFEEYAAREPKGYLTGWAHAIAKRPAAAQAEWRAALTLVDERLKTDARNPSLLNQRALLLALTGQREAAREAWQLRVELGGEQNPVGLEAETQVLVALNEPEAALAAIEREWSRRKPMGRVRALPVIRYHPAYAVIRGDPRLQRILKEDEAELHVLKEQQTRSAPAKEPTTASSAADAKSVAVLAFANLSDDKANEYFSDGISEELLNVLAKVPGLKVAARTSAFYFKGKEVPIPEIARQLGVAYVLEGSVRKQGDKVRITAQLIKAADGFRVWSDTFTRDLKDIFAVQDEIAGLIAKNLELKMSMGESVPRQAVRPDAYQAFLLGRSAAAKASVVELREAVGHFERAVALEPKYTAAWVQLASIHTRLGRWGGAPTLASWAAARAAIDQALALEPESPDVLLAQGWILRTAEWDWRGAERSFRRALALQPNNPEILAGTAVLLFNIGQTEEAFRLARLAVQLDPLNPSTQIDLSIMFFESKNWVESERAARRALQLAPGGTSYHSVLAWPLINQGRYAEAEASLALDLDVVQQSGTRGLLGLARGDLAMVREMLARLEQLARTEPDRADLQTCTAWLYAGLGDKDRAFAALEKARISRDPSIAWLRENTELTPLFSDPRWQELMRKVGLADGQ
ncbi:invasion protein regulator [Lacunisphaera limnophila]|uniref:Invasion protein regulator n=1 Tax=Lacunisphaera limnophila TaxID=1838286 RepID=A0A1D8AS12_9BACT|nr:TIR domain-containing protein [Lacunisphaera limnophila]AOS43662.1 invasion protein regulator [Lacunisphaera limnophila]